MARSNSESPVYPRRSCPPRYLFRGPSAGLVEVGWKSEHRPETLTRDKEVLETYKTIADVQWKACVATTSNNSRLQRPWYWRGSSAEAGQKRLRNPWYRHQPLRRARVHQNIGTNRRRYATLDKTLFSFFDWSVLRCIGVYMRSIAIWEGCKSRGTDDESLPGFAENGEQNMGPWGIRSRI